jgi:hypothetical protein
VFCCDGRQYEFHNPPTQIRCTLAYY